HPGQQAPTGPTTSRPPTGARNQPHHRGSPTMVITAPTAATAEAHGRPTTGQSGGELHGARREGMLLAVNHPGEYTVPATRRAPAIENPPSLVDLAATTLRRMIISGELRCGQRIIENRLTRELGISRPPLREALRVL